MYYIKQSISGTSSFSFGCLVKTNNSFESDSILGWLAFKIEGKKAEVPGVCLELGGN